MTTTTKDPSTSGVLPGTPAGEADKGPGIVPATPAEAREPRDEAQGTDSSGRSHDDSLPPRHPSRRG